MEKNSNPELPRVGNWICGSSLQINNFKRESLNFITGQSVDLEKSEEKLPTRISFKYLGHTVGHKLRRILMLLCLNSATNTNRGIIPWESPNIFINRQCLHERTHAHTNAHTNALTHAYAYVVLYMNNALNFFSQ